MSSYTTHWMTSFDLGEKENMQTVSSMLVYHTSHVMKNS